MKKTNEFLDILTKNNKNASENVGIEFSNDDCDNDIAEKPYNPADIRIDTKFFSVSDIYRWMNEDPPKITIKPSFQRNFVWNTQKKSLLIESLMLRIPIPSFYFYEDNDGNKYVIDGLQRLSTISDFISGQFKLEGLQYVGETCDGKNFKDLERKYITRIEETQLLINIMDSRTPELVKFEVFKRINTGGIPLNPQEIRNVLAENKTRELLSDMSKSKEFIKATHNAVKDIRMDAQELCLRFITFYKAFDDTTMVPEKDNPIAKMLDECIIYLNKCDEETLYNYKKIFKCAMEKAYAALGKQTFTKPGKGNRYIINKPLFTSWSVILAHSELSKQILENNQNRFIEKLNNKINNDTVFFNAITSSTTTKKSIEIQFRCAYELLEELKNADQS